MACKWRYPPFDHLLFTKMVETHKKEKNTVITKITLIISNGEHIKHTLSTSKPYRHQQHLPKISQNVSGAVRMAIRYGRNTCTVR